MPAEKRVPLEGFVEYPEAEMSARVTEFSENLRRRRTVRDFDDRPVDKSIIEQAILAAGSAPSGANHQPWHFAIIQDPAKRKALRRPPRPKSGPSMRARRRRSGWKPWPRWARMRTSPSWSMRPS